MDLSAFFEEKTERCFHTISVLWFCANIRCFVQKASSKKMQMIEINTFGRCTHLCGFTLDLFKGLFAYGDAYVQGNVVNFEKVWFV